jgi:hypothetical protein
MQRSSKPWRPLTRTRLAILFALLIVSGLGGCARLAPKTAALKKVHDTYRTEFEQFIQLGVPNPGENLPKKVEGVPAFAQTLREIRDYRQKYQIQDNNLTPEAAHLTVLEGMIYVQSGQFGMAHLVEPAVTSAQNKLRSGTGAYVRDQLLAENFKDLAEGWQQISQASTQGTDLSELEKAAKHIGENLGKLDSSKLAKPEIDEGAIYLATSAAIFYVHIFKECQINAGATPPCAGVTLKDWLVKGRDLIGKYLTATERLAADNKDQATSPGGRLRYIKWYGFLNDRIKQP